MDLIIKIAAEGSAQARAAIEAVSGALRQQADQVRTHNALLDAGANLWRRLISVAGAYAGLQTLRQAVRAAEENAVALTQLRRAAGDATEALARQARELQRLTGIEDEQFLAAQRVLFMYGATAEQVRRLTPLAADLAAMLGVDLLHAVRLMRGALEGQALQLGRLNLEARSFDELITRLSERVRGQARASFEARGAAAQLRVTLSELQETIGQQLLPTVNAVAAAFNRWLGGEQWSRAVTDLRARVREAAESLPAAIRGVEGERALEALRTDLAARLERERSGLTALREEFAALERKLSTTSFSLDFAGHRRDTERYLELQRLIREQTRLVNTLETAWRDAGTEAARAQARVNLDRATFADRRPSLLQQAHDALATAAWRARQAVAGLNEQVTTALTRAAEDTAAWQRRTAALTEYRRGIEQINEALEQEAERRAAAAAEESRRREAGRFLDTFPGQLGAQSLALLQQIGTAAQNAAAIVTTTLGSAFRAIADQITQLILGTVSWGQALANIGRSILAQLVASIVNFFVTLAARALLTALFGAAITKAAAAASAAAWAGPAILASTATFGAAPAVGTSALLGSLAAAPAISAAATFAGGFASGGLVPPGERLIRVNEAGPEFVVNASATARHLPLLDAINRGSDLRQAPVQRDAPERPLRVVIVDNRRDADELLRDPRWKTALVNLSLNPR